MFRKYLIIGVFLIFLFFFGINEVKAEQKSGVITYPAYGNISLEEGTMEVWVTLCFDPKERINSWYRFMLFYLKMKNGAFGFFWKPAARGFVNTAVFENKNQIPIIGASNLGWKKGEIHHVAITWEEGKIFKLYLDGKLVSRGKFPEKMKGDLKTATISIGARGFWVDSNGKRHFYILDCPIIVDDFRISSITRKPEELGANIGKELTADINTLLLDHFNEDFVPDGKKQTIAEVISGFSGEKGGTPSKYCRFVKGKFGKSLCMFSEQ